MSELKTRETDQNYQVFSVVVTLQSPGDTPVIKISETLLSAHRTFIMKGQGILEAAI
jgi:hypothetical protein